MAGGEVRIHERSLPGVGHRFELDTADGRSLIVVARRDGSRDVSIREGDDDATSGTARLTREHAVAVGSLLLGARFAEGDLDADAGSMDVGIADVTPESPVVGRLPRTIEMPEDAEAVVVAVARDDTAQLLEDDRSRPCEPGDRLVVVARRDRLDDVVAYLSG